MKKRSRSLSGPLALLLLLAASAPLVAAPPAVGIPVRAAGPGERIDGPGQSAEVLRLHRDLAGHLLRVRPGESVRIPDWPVAPEDRADVLVTRHEVYAPGAKVWKVEGDRRTEIPRSRVAFFWGESDGAQETRVLISVDPDSGEYAGFTQTSDAMHEIHPLHVVDPSARGTGRHVVAPPEFFQGGKKTDWTCAQTGAPLEFLENTAEASTTGPIFAAAISSLHTATIAIDTDNELLVNKFGNNTTTANNYIASLFAAMNVIYERDLLVRLLIGDVFLRTGNSSDGNSFNDDPWIKTSAFDKLDEFGDYWAANYAAKNRALAAMLSGRGTSGASGIAWVNSLCSKTYGYSYNQLYLSGTSVGFGDVLVTAHEIGHNFGSPHTHCYNPPLDNCYNAEGGCYTGTKTCPAPQTINGVTNVTGTLMSYCHISGLASCNSSLVMHPGTINRLDPLIEAKVGTCILPAEGGSVTPTVASVSPMSGSTAGGTPVTIIGTNFQAGAAVTFGGTAATSVVVVNSTRITALTPARATGKVAVAVTNPGGQGATLNDAFFYAPPPSVTNFYTVSPCRVIDTRNPNGARGGPELSANQTRTFTVTGVCGIPATAESIVVNITVINPAASGNLQIFPGNGIPTGTSAISFRPGSNLANNGIVLLSTSNNGTIGVKNGSAGIVDFVLDVTGYYQ